MPTSTMTIRALADAIDAPVLVMQAEPKQVFTANSEAIELFGKELDQIEKHRGGQVFDCVHAFTSAGCGNDIHCQRCKIKNAVVETLATGRPCMGIAALLNVRKNAGAISYTLEISTEKIGDMALIRIDQYGHSITCN